MPYNNGTGPSRRGQGPGRQCRAGARHRARRGHAGKPSDRGTDLGNCSETSRRQQPFDALRGAIEALTERLGAIKSDTPKQ